MEKIERARVVENFQISANNIYKLTLEFVKTNQGIKPGQFVNISVPGVFLPRPISVSDYNEYTGKLNMIYRVVGEGTDIMSKFSCGDRVDLLVGLGNGFTISEDIKKPLIVGGGLGVAPLYYLAKTLYSNGQDPKVLLGFKDRKEAYYINNFEKFSSDVRVSYDTDGLFVTDLMKEELTEEDYDYFYACGPKPMLKAVSDASLTDGELSLESRMACGIGICKCCSIETNDGMKTLCNDGPVLKKGTIRW